MRIGFDATPRIALSAQSEAVKEGWTNFKNSSAKAPSAIKDARLAVIVLLFEGMNWAKMGNDCIVTKDTKSYAMLLASTMSNTALLLDVVSTPAKEILSASSWTYQKIKLMGGVLSGSAAIMAAVFDVAEVFKLNRTGEVKLSALYFGKAVMGGRRIDDFADNCDLCSPTT